MAYDSILREKFAPVIDQAAEIVSEGLAHNDPLALAVQRRLNQIGVKSDDENYKEEVCAYLVEETAKQKLPQKPQVVQWFSKVKSTVNIWLVEHGWIGAENLSAQDIAAIAANNVRELSKLKIEQAFVQDSTQRQSAIRLSTDEVFLDEFQEQKAVLDQSVPGRFVLEAYAGNDTVELGRNITLRDAIKEAKYLFGDQELDNIAFVGPDEKTLIHVDESLARN